MNVGMPRVLGLFRPGEIRVVSRIPVQSEPRRRRRGEARLRWAGRRPGARGEFLETST